PPGLDGAGLRTRSWCRHTGVHPGRRQRRLRRQRPEHCPRAGRGLGHQPRNRRVRDPQAFQHAWSGQGEQSGGMIARSPQRASGPGQSGPGTLPGTEGRKGVGTLVRRFGPSILINGVAPSFIYFVLHHQFQVAELPALLATGIPPLLDALVCIVRWRRIVFLAGFVLSTIALAVVLVALGGDPRLYLIDEPFITAGMRLLLFLSNPLPRRRRL